MSDIEFNGAPDGFNLNIQPSEYPLIEWLQTNGMPQERIAGTRLKGIFFDDQYKDYTLDVIGIYRDRLSHIDAPKPIIRICHSRWADKPWYLEVWILRVMWKHYKSACESFFCGGKWQIRISDVQEDPEEKRIEIDKRLATGMPLLEWHLGKAIYDFLRDAECAVDRLALHPIGKGKKGKRRRPNKLTKSLLAEAMRMRREDLIYKLNMCREGEFERLCARFEQKRTERLSGKLS